ncbi:MAG TPA: C4-type zinc ribbon domain-containing protein [Pirellula sp.]|nr:C4-type zinc ribbon domain-containing protein [Pirellula sp.]
MTVNDSVVRNLHQHLVQIADIKSQIERGPRQVNAAIMQVETAREALQKCKDTIKQKKMDADRKQLQLREREAKVHDWEGKMNIAKNNREFQAIREQIAADSHANSVLSDEILEILEEIDSLQISSKGFEEKLKLFETERVNTESTVSERLAGLNIELERVQGNLTNLEKQLSADFLVQYKRLVSNRSEDSMAALDDVSCGGCNTGLPPRILDSLRKEQAIVCPSCGRLLYRLER